MAIRQPTTTSDSSFDSDEASVGFQRPGVSLRAVVKNHCIEHWFGRPVANAFRTRSTRHRG